MLTGLEGMAGPSYPAYFSHAHTRKQTHVCIRAHVHILFSLMEREGEMGGGRKVLA